MRFPNLLLLITVGVAGGVLACDKVSFPVVPADEQFRSTLTGTNEVPSVTTPATGSAQFAVTLDTFLAFRLDVAGIDSTMAARIYTGGAGATGGDTVAILFVGPSACRDASGQPINVSSPSCRSGYTGQLSQGQFKPSQLTKLPASYGTTERARFDSVLVLMRTGNVYINVHTRRNAGGEVRGQIRLP